MSKNLFGSLLKNENMYRASTIVDDMKEKVPQRKPFYPTSPSLAWSTAVGCHFGSVELMYGPKSSGKTMIALDKIKRVLATDPEVIAVFFDAELGFEFESTVRWMKANGVDTDRVLVVREVNIKTIFNVHIFQNLEKAITEDGVKIGIMVFDSIAAMGVKDMPTKLTKQNIEGLTKGDYGARARFLADIFPFFRQFVRNHRPYVIFINQARDDGEDFFGNRKYKTNGGESLYHELQYRYLIEKTDGGDIFAEDTKDVKGKPVAIGQRSNWVCEKNKMGEGLNRRGYVDMIYMKGITNVEEEITELGAKIGIIKQSGAYFEFDGVKKQGLAKFADYLREKPEVYQAIFDQVMLDASNTSKYS